MICSGKFELGLFLFPDLDLVQGENCFGSVILRIEDKEVQWMKVRKAIKTEDKFSVFIAD